MQAHEERVVLEKKELDEKLSKLKDFCFSGNKIFSGLSPEERDSLEEQYSIMQQYSEILGVRIKRFSKEK